MTTWKDFVEENPGRVASDSAGPVTVGDVPRDPKYGAMPKELVPLQHRSEEDAQAAVIEWSENRKVRARLPEVGLLFHVPNGGQRHGKVAADMKAAGVKRGVPDLLLPVPRERDGDALRGFWTGLAIEMKGKHNDVEKGDAQYRWLRRLQRQGWATEVCHSARLCIATIEEYLLDSTAFIPAH